MQHEAKEMFIAMKSQAICYYELFEYLGFIPYYTDAISLSEKSYNIYEVKTLINFEAKK